MNNTKKLTKSMTDKKICGVCGGIAEYLGCDSTWIRLAFAFLFLCGSLGLWPYLICAIILPKETPAEFEPAEPEIATKRCANCGSLIAAESEFCPVCGTKQEEFMM